MKSTADIPTLQTAIQQLCGSHKFQSGEHIKPVHAYCASRLVVEGGFPPDWVNPRPPFASSRVNNTTHKLALNQAAKGKSETRVLGGIKYKDVDVTVLVPNIGPALAISAKNTSNAFRNLTNRMEEALGECTNIHMMYPGFVFGFLHLIKFNTVSDVGKPDASFAVDGTPLPAISRYHEVLISLSGRSTITDPGMRYEAVGLLVYRCRDGKAEIWRGYPAESSPVHFSNFFHKLYAMYDLRYGYPDPDGPNIRKDWNLVSPLRRERFDTQLKLPWSYRQPE